MLGSYAYLKDVINLTNKSSNNSNKITTSNLTYCLLYNGINFNTHNKYFERSYMVYRGNINEITDELSSDAIMFSLFYIQMAFSNKPNSNGEELKNYIVPFSARELGCEENELNTLLSSNANKMIDENNKDEDFDFREYLKQFKFSKEAMALYKTALEIFLFYHKNNEYSNKNYNDSFYDITNTIMGKDNSSAKILDIKDDRRISKTKTTKGTKGFSRNNIKYVVSSEYLEIFESFFNARDVLARKINKQLVDSNLLLWERENIY